jgi:hypothetical protein
MSNPLNKDAYLSLTNGNIAGLEENVEEYLDILAEENEDEPDNLEALRGIVTETMKFLSIQRKLNAYLEDNVPQPDRETVDYAMEVSEQLGITAFGVRVVPVPQDVAYKEALDILFQGE